MMTVSNRVKGDDTPLRNRRFVTLVALFFCGTCCNLTAQGLEPAVSSSNSNNIAERIELMPNASTTAGAQIDDASSGWLPRSKTFSEVKKTEVLAPAKTVGPTADTRRAVGNLNQMTSATAQLASRPMARTVFARSQPIDVTKPVNVTQVFLAEQQIPSGSLLTLKPFQRLASWYQSIDARGENYVALTGDIGQRWQMTLSEEAAATSIGLRFLLVGDAIEAGERFDIQYRNLRLSSALSDHVTLPVTLQPPGEYAELLESEAKEIAVGPSAKIRLEFPAIIRAGVTNELWGMITDQRGQPTDPPFTSLDLIINNKLSGEVNVDRSPFYQDLSFDRAGDYELFVRSPGGGVQSQKLLVKVTEQETQQLIWTDFSPRHIEYLMSRLATTTAEPPHDSAPVSTAAVAVEGSVAGIESQSIRDLKGTPATPSNPSALFDPTPMDVPSRNGNAESAIRGNLRDSRPSLAASDAAPQFGEARTRTDEAVVNDTQAVDPSAVAAPLRAVASGRQVSWQTPDDPQIPEYSDRINPQNSSKTPTEVDLVAVEPPIKLGLYSHYFPIAEGGQYQQLVMANHHLTIAQPESTSDRRLQQYQLVQSLVRGSSHDWFTTHLADQGNPFGVVSSVQSFGSKSLDVQPITGIWINPEQQLIEALAQGQTFVSSGHRAMLKMSVNKTQFGRAVNNPLRLIDLTITSQQAPIRAHLKRNGAFLRTLDFESRTSNQAAVSEQAVRAPKKRGRLYVLLASDSRPRAPGITPPRNGREWLGKIEMSGLTLLDAAGPKPGHEQSSENLRISPETPSVDFLTWTQGGGALIRIDVEPRVSRMSEASRAAITDEGTQAIRKDDADVLAPASVTLHIAEGFEDLGFADIARPAAPTPGFQERFDLAGLTGEGIYRLIGVEGYSDKVQVWFDPEVEIVRETRQSQSLATFVTEVIDQSDTRPGDYYTAWVLLEDGTELYSSPIFVGGFDTPKDRSRITSSQDPSPSRVRSDSIRQSSNLFSEP